MAEANHILAERYALKDRELAPDSPSVQEKLVICCDIFHVVNQIDFISSHVSLSRPRYACILTIRIRTYRALAVGAQSRTLRGRMNTIDTDRDLVRRVQQGDRQAFDMLVVRHQRRIAHVISRYIKSPQEIEDVTQETFLKAYRGIMAFRKDSQFSTWLHRIGVNTAIDYLSAKRSRIPLYDPPDDDAHELMALKAIDDEDPERLLASRQIAETVSSALKQLSEDLRTAITLREMEGLSYEEIARIMKCPVGTVRSRIFRARESVAAALRPLLDSSRDKRW